MRSQVLVVDDDELCGRATTRWLRRCGYHVTCVTTATAALAAPGPFHILVLDIELPDGNGVDLAERFREAGRREPIVFYSACDDIHVLARARAIGTLVTKSAEVENLNRAVLDAIDRAYGYSSDATPVPHSDVSSLGRPARKTAG